MRIPSEHFSKIPVFALSPHQTNDNDGGSDRNTTDYGIFSLSGLSSRSGGGSNNNNNFRRPRSASQGRRRHSNSSSQEEEEDYETSLEPATTNSSSAAEKQRTSLSFFRSFSRRLSDETVQPVRKTSADNSSSGSSSTR